MKHFVLSMLIAVMAAGGLPAAEEAFSKAVSAEDFAAAGLGKLTAKERARLDVLVREFKRGGGTAGYEVGRSAGAKKEQVAPAAAVRVAPGTVVEVGDVESVIAGDFDGWSGKTVFLLENGQRWRVANAGEYYSPKLVRPKVKISPAGLGGYWMTIEGVTTRVKVLSLGGK
jgi:hypothetical protein